MLVMFMGIERDKHVTTDLEGRASQLELKPLVLGTIRR
jgi:hypothetical protein